MTKKVYEVDPLVRPEDRGEFIMDFWAMCDPDPSTPEKEFRSQYNGFVDSDQNESQFKVYLLTI